MSTQGILHWDRRYKPRLARFPGSLCYRPQAKVPHRMCYHLDIWHNLIPSMQGTQLRKIKHLKG